MPNNYSSDQAIDNLVADDKNIMVAGYVDCFEPRKVVGQIKDKKVDMQKFVLNNGGSQRLTCILWGKDTIVRHQALLTFGQNLLIKNASTQEANSRYWKPEQNVHRIEIHIGNETVIEDKGRREEQSLLDLAAAEQKSFAEIELAGPGFYKMDGFLGSKFTSFTSSFGNYCTASLTDGFDKINIRVRGVGAIPETLISGRKVLVHGVVEANATTKILHLWVEKFEHIHPDMEAELADEMFLLNGTRATKKRTIDEVE